MLPTKRTNRTFPEKRFLQTNLSLCQNTDPNGVFVPLVTVPSDSLSEPKVFLDHMLLFHRSLLAWNPLAIPALCVEFVRSPLSVDVPIRFGRTY